MEVALCKNCKRFEKYTFSTGHEPLVICHWRPDKETPWSKEQGRTAIKVKTGEAMSRKELKEWTKKPYGKLRNMSDCSCYEKEETGQMAIF